MSDSSAGVTARLLARAITLRSKLPAPLRLWLESLATQDTWVARGVLRLSGSREFPLIAVPRADPSVYIGPLNYAGQGYFWARAIEEFLPGAAARNASLTIHGGFGFATDYEVPVATYMMSRKWQESQLESLTGFTHVIIESFTSLLGNHWRGSLTDEVADLQSRGLHVALLCHGTDIRLPSRHLARDQWSLFSDDPRRDAIEETAIRNLALIDELGLPVFVSTPDLLIDVPGAQWCPVVVDPSSWAGSGDVLERPVPRVIHAPSAALVKGTHLISDTMETLHREGIVDFHLVKSVPHTLMPTYVGEADIVLDQFRLGSYGGAACEALAAGRVVIGHVSEDVRQSVRDRTGMELPIVEATPSTLEAVIRDLVEDRAHAREIAQSGPGFVAAVHSGQMSAHVLGSFLNTRK